MGRGIMAGPRPYGHISVTDHQRQPPTRLIEAPTPFRRGFELARFSGTAIHVGRVALHWYFEDGSSQPWIRRLASEGEHRRSQSLNLPFHSRRRNGLVSHRIRKDEGYRGLCRLVECLYIVRCRLITVRDTSSE